MVVAALAKTFRRGGEEEDTISGYGHVMNEKAGTAEVRSQMEGRTKDIMLNNDVTSVAGKLDIVCYFARFLTFSHHLVIPMCAFILDETML